jgi:hypothetical protein
MTTTKTAVLLLCCGAAWTSCSSGPRSSAPEAGTELYAVAPESVNEVLFTSGAVKLFAYRWKPEDPFHIFVSSRTGPPQQCTGGGQFQEWLKAVSRLPVLRETDQRFEPGSPEWGDLRLRDNTQLEPIDVRLRLPSSDREPVVIQVDDRQFLVDVNAAVVRRAASGCADIGR